MFACSAPALAQSPGPATSLKGGAAPQVQAQAPATEQDPQAVLTLLKSVHGFTRAELDAASSDVPAILEWIIDDRSGSTFLRRQAIKALQLYPGDETFFFIAARVDAAPLGMKRLYLTTLSGFGSVDPNGVSAVLDRALDDADPTVRHAAVASAAQMAAIPPVRALLQSREGRDPEPAINEAIRKALRAN